MSSQIVNICSDSKNLVLNISRANSSQSQELNSENVRSDSDDNNIVRADPLFKIIFRDEITSRKYRKRIEDIIKYVMSMQINENNNNATESNLLLEIYDSIESNCSSKIVCSSQKETLCISIDNNNNKRKKQHSPDPHENKKRPKFEPESEVEFLRNDKESQCNQEPQDQSNFALNERVEHMQNINENSGRQSCIRTNEIEHEKNCNPINNKFEICFKNCFVKIGTHEYFRANSGIYITKYYLTLLYVPTLKNDYFFYKWIIINIDLKNVSKVLVDFENPKPKLYFMVCSETAEDIRNLLNMNDPNGPYFDPESLDQNHQYIIISPAKISDETKNALKKSLKNKIFSIDTLTVNKTVALVAKTNDVDKAVTTSSNELQTSSEPPSIGHTDTDNLLEIFYCKIIRIGSYEYVKKKIFSISENEVKFCAPTLSPLRTIVLIKVDMNQITEIGIYFSNLLSVIFLYITMEAARDIRNILGMTDPAGLHIDPTGDDIHNKIIIFPQKISENSSVIKKLLSTGKVKALDEENASSILAKSLSSVPCQPPENFQPVLNIPQTGKIKLDLNDVNIQIELNIECLKMGALNLKKNYIKFAISNEFLKFIVTPHLMCRGGTFYVKFSEVTKIFYYLSKKWKVLCFYTTDFCAEKISSLLRLYDTNNLPYLDPFSHDPLRQNICIIPKSTKPGTKFLKELLKNVSQKVPSKKMNLKELRYMMDSCYQNKIQF